MHWRRKWQATPVFLPGESQGQGSLVGCHLWGHTELDTTEVKQQQQQQQQQQVPFIFVLFFMILRGGSEKDLLHIMSNHVLLFSSILRLYPTFYLGLYSIWSLFLCMYQGIFQFHSLYLFFKNLHSILHSGCY